MEGGGLWDQEEKTLNVGLGLPFLCEVAGDFGMLLVCSVVWYRNSELGQTNVSLYSAPYWSYAFE